MFHLYEFICNGYFTLQNGCSFIYLVAYINTSFLWLNSIPLYVCNIFCLFLQWWTLGLLLSFGTAITMHICVIFWMSVFNSFEHIPMSRIVGSCGNYIFNFLRNQQISTTTEPFCFPVSNVKGFHFLPFLTNVHYFPFLLF